MKNIYHYETDFFIRENMSCRDKIAQMMLSGTASEQKIARELLSDYPVSALGSLPELAARAQVSVPTLQRMVVKLGFTGFADFRREVTTELSQEQGASPLSRLSQPQSDSKHSNYHQTLRNIEKTFAHLPPALLQEAADLLADETRSVWCLGGRFTGTLATLFARHLKTIRTGVHEFIPYEGAFADVHTNTDAHSVIFITDIRRYDAPIYELCKANKDIGAKVILLTDTWGSPTTAYADIVIAVHTTSPSGWDSNAALLVVLEELMALVTKKAGDPGRKLLKKRERFKRKI